MNIEEIKFRAKIAGTDAWIYGIPARAYKDNWIDGIIDEGGNFEYIKTDTLGQYACKKDEGDEEIYEGDIVEYYSLEALYSDAGSLFGVEPQNNYSVFEIWFEKRIGEVILENGCWQIRDIKSGRKQKLFITEEEWDDEIIDTSQGDWDYRSLLKENGLTELSIKVIGNKFDNPELSRGNNQ